MTGQFAAASDIADPPPGTRALTATDRERIG